MKKIFFCTLLSAMLLCSCAPTYTHLNAFMNGKIDTNLYNIKDGYQAVYRNIVNTGDRCMKEDLDDSSIRSNLYTDISKGEIVFYAGSGIVAYAEVIDKDGESTLKVYCYQKRYPGPETIKKWASGLNVCK
ncbi:MAG: hypothetical protein GY868_02325 [Deltaproteobacteria bacterium]|nr:hypothetical protein [Deltaproteobacteria bacterium]